MSFFAAVFTEVHKSCMFFVLFLFCMVYFEGKKEPPPLVGKFELFFTFGTGYVVYVCSAVV